TIETFVMTASSSAIRTIKQLMMAEVPKLDFSRFSQGTKQEKEEFGEALTKALIEHGFVKLEHFDAGPLDDAQFPNLWPDENDLPGFRETIANHYQICKKVAHQLMAAVEIGMGLSAGVLVDRCRQEASEISLNRYPQIATETLAEGHTKRIWPHTDYGVITLLFQDGVGGLELEDRTRPGEFLPVTPTAPGGRAEMVVNASDTFERWTNGVVRAGLHRVTLPCDEKRAVVPERYSCAFFQKASRETSAGPLPHFVTEDNPARYDEITALQFQQRRNRLHY
ncbi:hypothetical protein PoMZ_09363, partial [Pyricularia oryzae]